MCPSVLKSLPPFSYLTKICFVFLSSTTPATFPIHFIIPFDLITLKTSGDKTNQEAPRYAVLLQPSIISSHIWSMCLEYPHFFLSSLWGPNFTPIRNNRKYDSCVLCFMSLGGAGVAHSVSGCLRDRGSGLLFSPQTPCWYCPICVHEVDRTPSSLTFPSFYMTWRDIHFRRHEASSLSPRQEFSAYSGILWLIITVFTRSRHLSPS